MSATARRGKLAPDRPRRSTVQCRLDVFSIPAGRTRLGRWRGRSRSVRGRGARLERPGAAERHRRARHVPHHPASGVVVVLRGDGHGRGRRGLAGRSISWPGAAGRPFSARVCPDRAPPARLPGTSGARLRPSPARRSCRRRCRSRSSCCWPAPPPTPRGDWWRRSSSDAARVTPSKPDSRPRTASRPSRRSSAYGATLALGLAGAVTLVAVGLYLLHLRRTRG